MRRSSASASAGGAHGVPTWRALPAPADPFWLPGEPVDEPGRQGRGQDDKPQETHLPARSPWPRCCLVSEGWTQSITSASAQLVFEPRVLRDEFGTA